MKKNNQIELQTRLFQRLQEVLPSNSSIIDELADLLDISADSVYRRMRNETILTIDEVAILCDTYKISFDSICGSNSHNVTFNYGIFHTQQDFINHMKFMLGELNLFKRSPNCEFTYAAIDIPIFHHFQFRELTAFKMFYWLKSVVSEPSFVSKKFDPSLISEELMATCMELHKVYKSINSVEIWTDTTIHSLIKQIDFFWESGMFATKEDALLLCNQAEEEILAIRTHAENSSKLPDCDNFKLYFSEIEIGNNSLLAVSDSFKRAYLSFNTINIIVTTHSVFCNETEEWLVNLIKKSTLISGASEKIRFQFFKRALDSINSLRLKIEG